MKISPLTCVLALAFLFLGSSAMAGDHFSKPKTIGELYLHMRWKLTEKKHSSGKFLLITKTTVDPYTPILLTSSSASKDVDKKYVEMAAQHPDGQSHAGTFTYTKAKGWSFKFENPNTPARVTSDAKAVIVSMIAKPPIEMTLMDPDLKKDLMKIATKNLAVENYEFLVLANQFIATPTGKLWKQIYKDCIADSAKNQINLPSGLSSELKALQKSKNPESDPKLLKAVLAARDEIRSLIVKNITWKSFRAIEEAAAKKLVVVG